MSEDAPKSWTQIQAESRAAHKQLADKLHALSLAGSFAALFFLIDLESLIPPEEAKNLWALQAAWCMAYFSATFGSIHLWLGIFQPLFAARVSYETSQQIKELGREGVLALAEKRIKRFLWWGIPLYVHIVTLLLLFFLSAWYRFSNLHLD